MMTRIARFTFAALFASGVAAGAAAGYEPPEGTVEFRIHHSKYDVIGSHIVTFSRDGADRIVDVSLSIKVKLLFITLHSLQSKRHEVWRDGQFVAYRANTDENSELSEVKAGMEGGNLVIDGVDGRVTAPEAVFPTHPWNPAIVEQTLLMDTKTGKLLKVSVQAAGDESVDVAGKPVPTDKFTISGDLEREIWFDNAGNLIQFRFVSDGATVTFTRTTPMP